jgi:hypothetical protein
MSPLARGCANKYGADHPTPAALALAARVAAVPLYGRAETIDQDVLIEGLGQEASRAIFERAGADALIGNRRDENERHAVSLGPQPGLQLNPAHRGHPDIGDHAPGIVQLRRLQKGLGGWKKMDDVSERPQEIVYRGANGCIVVND